MSPSLNKLDMIALPTTDRRRIASAKRSDQEGKEYPQQKMRRGFPHIIFSLLCIRNRVGNALPGLIRIEARLCHHQLRKVAGIFPR